MSIDFCWDTRYPTHWDAEICSGSAMKVTILSDWDNVSIYMKVQSESLWIMIQIGIDLALTPITVICQ